jgi:tRNA-dihydrouridine synthase B
MSVLSHASRKEPIPPFVPDPSFRPIGIKAREFQLEGLNLDGRVFLAPMAGYTDRVFRRLCRQSGAAMVTTEMVSARALLKDSRKTMRLMEFGEDGRPVAVQLFGGDPGVMGEAAAIVHRSVRPDSLDVNFGCPIGKILKSDSGAALLKNPRKAGEIVQAMVGAVQGRVPVTVKTRAGYDAFDGAALEVLKASEEAGAAAFTLHARTRRQMYGDQADWSAIAQAKRNARIPVVGNGDVRTPADAGRMMQETGCDAVMLGRAAVGAPWIFRMVNEYLETGKISLSPSLRSRLSTALVHYQDAVAREGPRQGLLGMRKHLAHYLKGFDGARDLRQAVLVTADPEMAMSTLRDYIARLPED